MSRVTALVTLAIGDMPEFAMSHPIFRRYAKRHKLDFVHIRQRRYALSTGWFEPRRHQWLFFEKHQIRKLLERYERIIYLDGDILLTPACPNLLELVPTGKLGCVFEDIGPRAWERHDELTRAQNSAGVLPTKPAGYFNAGVLVVDRAHRQLFDLHECPPVGGRWPEQTALNYHANRLGLLLYPLPARCNLLAEFTTAWAHEGQRRAAWVIHYAGRVNRPLMAKDFPTIAATWMDQK